MAVETSKSANIIKAPGGIELRILFMNRIHTLQIYGTKSFKPTGSGVKPIKRLYVEQCKSSVLIMISMQAHTS